MDFNKISSPCSPTWCPGCGNYGIWASIKQSITKLEWGVDKYVFVYDVGCSGNMTDFIKSHGFHSLHGRALPSAEGVKLANHDLNVFCVIGDGGCYGEGGNHLLHAMRGNTDITVIVHDNRIYGLTTGQTSPTSPKGFKSKSTPQGAIEYPLDVLTLGITQGATFVAQGFAGDIPHLAGLMDEAFNHKGFTLINILQPCVTFNKVATYQFFREHVYKLDESHNSEDKTQALSVSLSTDDRIPLGTLYKTNRPTYQDQENILSEKPLVRQSSNTVPDMSILLKKFV